LETAIFRTVQESLTNVLRHSGSSKASITLREVKSLWFSWAHLGRVSDLGNARAYTTVHGRAYCKALDTYIMPFIARAFPSTIF
jgi:hypothetical protein